MDLSALIEHGWYFVRRNSADELYAACPATSHATEAGCRSRVPRGRAVTRRPQARARWVLIT